MRHYQARCALTRPKVKIDRDGKEVTLRPKHLVLATGLPLGFGRASALEVLKDWGHQGPKLCFLGLVVRCILKVIFPEDLVYGIKGPIVIMFIHHCVHHYLISTLLLHENLHHFGRGPRYGNPSIPELEDASTFKGEVFHSSLYKNGKKYEGRGQRISGWRNSKILRLKMASFFNTLISAKIWKSSAKKSQFLWWFPLWQSGLPEKMHWKKKTSCKTCLLSNHTRQKGRGRWLQHLGAWNLSQRWLFASSGEPKESIISDWNRWGSEARQCWMLSVVM